MREARKVSAEYFHLKNLLGVGSLLGIGYLLGSMIVQGFGVTSQWGGSGPLIPCSTSALCWVCAKMLGERGLGLVFHFPPGCVQCLHDYPVNVTVTVVGKDKPAGGPVPMLPSVRIVLSTIFNIVSYDLQ